MAELSFHLLIPYSAHFFPFAKLIKKKMKMMLNGGDLDVVLEAQAHVWKHTFNYITSMSLKCAVQLGIPDIISNHANPITLSELVKALSIPHQKSSQLSRLMRILVHSGFFLVQKTKKNQQGYVLTPSSRLLVKTLDQTNMSPFLLMMLDPVLVTPFQFMSAWFLGKESTPFETAFGTSIWNYFSKEPDVSRRFDKAMASDAEFVTNILLKEHRNIFEGYNSFLDVGGGNGTVVNAVSAAFPDLQCTIFDLPHVVADIQGSNNNIKIVAGDMFERVPSADIILLKWIMHDLDDDNCLKILKRCREAICLKGKGVGKVMLIEMVIDINSKEYESLESQLCIDMLMMVELNGKERTETEWEKLFLDSGFTSYRITPVLGLRSIIEVFP